MRKSKSFFGLLDKTFSLPVIKWPETLSTKEAEEILIQLRCPLGKKKKNGG